MLTDGQDLTAQRDPLLAMGVGPERIYVGHGPPGTNRERPGLREAPAACGASDRRVRELECEQADRELVHDSR